MNGQSGKGGISYLLRTGYGLAPPRRVRIEFSQVVQRAMDGSGREVTAAELWEPFRAEYLDRTGPVSLVRWRTSHTGPARHDFTGVIRVDGDEREYKGAGNGPIAALTDALRAAGVKADVLRFVEHSTEAGHDAAAVAYAECRVDGVTSWGAGRDTSVLAASVRAVLSAVNRAKGRPAGRQGQEMTKSRRS